MGRSDLRFEVADKTITNLVSHTDHIELPVDFVPFGTYHLDVWVGDAYRRSDDFVVYGRR